MSIDKLRPDPLRSAELRPRRTKEARPDEAPSPIGGAEPAGRVDRVEISTNARLLAARLEVDQPEGLAPERLAEIYERIDSGEYDSPESAEKVALRLFELGEL